MNELRRFRVKHLLFVTAFAALGCAWWFDRQSLSDRLLDANQKSERVIQENFELRQTLRSGRADRDSLFAHALAQQDAINQLKQHSVAAQQRSDSGQ